MRLAARPSACALTHLRSIQAVSRLSTLVHAAATWREDGPCVIFPPLKKGVVACDCYFAAARASFGRLCKALSGTALDGVRKAPLRHTEEVRKAAPAAVRTHASDRRASSAVAPHPRRPCCC